MFSCRGISYVFFYIILLCELYDGVVATARRLPVQILVVGLCVEFAFFFSGYWNLFPLSKNLYVRLIVDSKLS